jgi:uncharacterized protein
MSSNTTVQKGVTVIIKRSIKKGCQQEFETLISESEKVLVDFTGYNGLQVFNDHKTSHTTMVYQFDTEKHLDKWLSSKQKQDFWTKMDQISLSMDFEKLTGLEYWFNYSADIHTQPPKKYKMVLASVLAIYPLQLLVISPALEVVNYNLRFIPSLLTSLIAVFFSVTILTYLIMPQVTLILEDWLYNKR